MSANAIKEQNKKNADYRQYLLLKYSGQEYWKYVNGDQLVSMGLPGDAAQYDSLLYKLNGLYNIKKQKGEGLSTSSDEYKAVLRWYKAEYAKALRPEWAAPLREGPARRLMYTFLTDPGHGQKVDMKYVGSTLAQMSQKNPDFDYLMDSVVTFKRGQGDAARRQSATGFTAVLATAIQYRNKMAKTKNEWGDYNGITPSSKAGEPYVNKLTRLVNEWKKHSPFFRRRWDDIGGDSMIVTFLDSGT